MAEPSGKRVLVVGEDPVTAKALHEILTDDACCDTAVDRKEAVGKIAAGRYALIVVDAVTADELEAVVAAARAIPKRDRPLLFVLFADASTLPARLDPRVVTLLVRRPMNERFIREILGQAIRRIMAVGGEITLRRLREAGAVRPRKGPGKSAHVLVVDDDRPIRDLLATVLRREGLITDVAADGEAAIEALRTKTYRILVLDLMMPKLSGWEVIGWLRSNPENRPQSVIVCTAADRAIFAELDPEVVNAVFVKPFDVAEIGAYVRATSAMPLERDRRRRRIITPTSG